MLPPNGQSHGSRCRENWRLKVQGGDSANRDAVSGRWALTWRDGVWNGSCSLPLPGTEASTEMALDPAKSTLVTQARAATPPRPARLRTTLSSAAEWGQTLGRELRSAFSALSHSSPGVGKGGNTHAGSQREKDLKSAVNSRDETAEGLFYTPDSCPALLNLTAWRQPAKFSQGNQHCKATFNEQPIT